MSESYSPDATEVKLIPRANQDLRMIFLLIQI